jgi:L-fuconate dehydratase
MSELITAVEAVDVRFPTSRELDGSDAMNPEPDYSAAYVTIRTGTGDEGHGLAFTVGRGNDVEVAAVRALAPLVVGLPVEDVLADLGGFSRRLTGDSQLRWLGPEKGVIHLATAAIVNAVWDLYAKLEEKPLWKLLADMSPAELVGCVDFRYIDDVLTPDDALAILRRNEATKAEREQLLLAEGFPAYTTSAGWLGYPEATLPERAREALADGFTHLKLKVGADLESDLRRARLVREAIGPANRLSLDANQAWGVEQAIDAIRALSEVDPWWIEEPTSPDDVLGHRRIREAVAPVRVATGEHAQNRIVFKQLLQLDAIDACQVDCCRLGGVNEVLAVVLLAAKFGVPVCPHAGGVGLCEYAQHVSMFDYIAVGATLEDRVCEFVDHLHEHFVTPVEIRHGCYVAPTAPGAGTEMLAQSLSSHA